MTEVPINPTKTIRTISIARHDFINVDSSEDCSHVQCEFYIFFDAV